MLEASDISTVQLTHSRVDCVCVCVWVCSMFMQCVCAVCVYVGSMCVCVFVVEMGGMAIFRNGTVFKKIPRYH